MHAERIVTRRAICTVVSHDSGQLMDVESVCLRKKLLESSVS